MAQARFLAAVAAALLVSAPAAAEPERERACGVDAFSYGIVIASPAPRGRRVVAPQTFCADLDDDRSRVEIGPIEVKVSPIPPARGAEAAPR